jgi:cobalamin biosynthesis protein CobT
VEERNFRVEERLRSFARLITGHFSLKVVFEGDKAFLDEERMQIPPVQNTPEGFSRAKFYVCHECGHALFSDFAIMEEASEEDSRLPRILNSLEDARVERKMITRFPGLKRNMQDNIERIISGWDVKRMPLPTQLIYGIYLVGRGFDVSFFSPDARNILFLFEGDILKAVSSDDPYLVLECARRILSRIDELVKGPEEHDMDTRPSEGAGDKREQEDESEADSAGVDGHEEEGGKEGVSTDAVSGDEKDGTGREPEEIETQLSDEAKEELRISDFSCDSISDLIKSHFDEVRLPDDHDEMRGLEHLKDENNDEEKTIHIPPDGSLEEYSRVLKPLLSECNFLSREIERIVAQRRTKRERMAFRRRERKGILDTRNLWKIAKGEDTIFKRRIRGEGKTLTVDPDSLAIYILLDESWSMSGRERIKEAQKAVMILGEALDKLDIPFAITGYTTAKDMLMRFLYKGFQENFRRVKTRLLKIRARYGTYTAEHVPFARRRLEKRKERKKLLIVITDSEEIESKYRLKRAIDLAKEEGIEVIGIGIQTNLMADYYDRFIEIEEIESFAKEFCKRVSHDQKHTKDDEKAGR